MTDMGGLEGMGEPLLVEYPAFIVAVDIDGQVNVQAYVPLMEVAKGLRFIVDQIESGRYGAVINQDRS